MCLQKYLAGLLKFFTLIRLVDIPPTRTVALRILWVAEKFAIIYLETIIYQQRETVFIKSFSSSTIMIKIIKKAKDDHKKDDWRWRPVVEVQHQFPVSHSRSSRWTWMGLKFYL